MYATYVFKAKYVMLTEYWLNELNLFSLDS